MLSGFAAHCDPSLCQDSQQEESRLITGGDMPSRNAKFIIAIFASFLAGAPVAVLTHGAQAAGECISAPKVPGPEGSHWYYRVDRTTKRHCWYLMVGHQKLSQSAPKSFRSPPAAAPTASVQRPVADARAELRPQAMIERADRNEASTPAAPADLAATESKSDVVDEVQPNSVIATRWPEPSDVGSVTSSPPPTASYMTADAQESSAAPPPSAIAVAPPATADSSQGRSASIPMLFGVMTGALALAGITASVVLKLAGARSPAKSPARRDRLWEFTEGDKIPLSAQPTMDDLPRRASFARDLDRSEERKDRVAEFYQQLSRRDPG
jgi:hypothetical protein